MNPNTIILGPKDLVIVIRADASKEAYIPNIGDEELLHNGALFLDILDAIDQIYEEYGLNEEEEDCGHC